MGVGVVLAREGFEAALVVALVLAFLHRTGRGAEARAVWAGAGAAVGLSAAAAAVLFLVGAELEGRAEAAFEGVTMVAAASLLTWMIFWMRRQAGSLRADLEDRAGRALAARSSLALAAVVFVGVVREGLEAALLAFSSVRGSGGASAAIGGAAGLAVAVALGVLFYRGVGRLDVRRFFAVTSVLLIAFAAWLLALGLEELAEASAAPRAEALAWALFAALAAPTILLYLGRPALRRF